MNLDHLMAYLECLQPDCWGHVFYWSGLHPAGHRVQAYGTIEEMMPRLSQRNAEGYGIFTTINAMTPRVEDGLARRTKADVARVRAVVADWDTPEKEMPVPPLEPTMIVETSPDKCHLYWCTDDMELDQFEGVQRGIIQYFGSDRSIVDTTREIRVPGFMHTKGVPTPVKLMECSGIRYPAKQLMETFPFEVRKVRVRELVEVPPMAGLTHAIVDYVWGPARPDGGYNIPCPWQAEHTTTSSVSSTVYFPPSSEHGAAGYFKCMHSHCAERCADEYDRWLQAWVKSNLRGKM